MTVTEELNFEEAKRLSGRVNDPKTAPMVPVYIEINGREGAVDVKVSGWNRSSDDIIEYRFHVRGEDMGEMIRRPLTTQDAEWLANIGARP